ncbi:MAG: hypothetical protein IIZ53_04025 [Ruminococcus sp.]|nr:hypothetical protein [Ruminococcus sp.]
MKKKNSAIAGGIIAVLFIAPLIVFAALYYSHSRRNIFTPGSVDIQVNEGGKTSQMLENDDYEWSGQGSPVESYKTNKPIYIKDTRKNPGEMLRVALVPVWLDSEDNICSVFDFSSYALNGDSLVYTDEDKTLTLELAPDWEADGWSYKPSDGFFYYTGALDSNKFTSKLLQSVQLNPKAYDELTENYVFRLDVLADAIQTSDNAADERDWETE